MARSRSADHAAKQGFLRWVLLMNSTLSYSTCPICLLIDQVTACAFMSTYQESNDRSMRLQQETARLMSRVKVYYHVAQDERVDLARPSCRSTYFLHGADT
jgi:hypothetical protein